MRTTHNLDVIFDFDGVLADSAPLIVAILGPAIEEATGILPTDGDIRSVIGPPFREAVSMLCTRLGVSDGTPVVEDVVARFRAEYATRVAAETPMYPGIAAAIDELAQQHRLSICSSKPQPMVEGIVDAWAMRDRFPLIEAADPNRDEPKLRLLERLVTSSAIPPGRALVVGDTRFDALAARAVGIPMIGVAWGIGAPTELREHGATAIADDPQHLVSLILSERERR